MVDLEPSSPHLRIVEDDALDLLFHPDRWWGGWDLNPRSPVPETGIFYARMDILDQAAPTQGGLDHRPYEGEKLGLQINHSTALLGTSD